MSKSIGAAFSVRFVNNGDQIMLTRDIVKSNGDGAALFQAIDTQSGTVTPSWTDAAEQPIIQLGVRSAMGFPTRINSVAWSYNGTALSFSMSGSTWVAEVNGQPFSARINGNRWELKITGNLVSKAAVANKQIGYSVNYTSNGQTDDIEGSVDVVIQVSGSDSHVLQVAASRVELDEEHTAATLTAYGYYGGQPVSIGSNGYTIKWFNGETELSGQTSATLTVSRDMVEGGNLFIAKLYLNGVCVAMDAQRISDIADEYQILYTPAQDGHNFVSLTQNATYTLSVTRNGRTYSGSVAYSWDVYNGNAVKVKSGTGASVVIDASCCLIGSDDSGNGIYSDCDINVMAEY